MPLLSTYNESNKFEIGVDECARGPMFGRLYTAAVVLPKDDSFRHDWMKDSKKIKSKKKMRELSDYIKQNATAWCNQYVDADVIDKINIRQAVFRGMKESIKQVLAKLDPTGAEKEKETEREKKTMLVIDGNDFLPYVVFDQATETLREIPHVTVEKGDGTYSFIAAASILAKNAHDEYVLDLCEQYPELKTRYSLHENMGYGTAKHMAGIKEHGITQWHRRTFGICKTAKISHIL